MAAAPRIARRSCSSTAPATTTNAASAFAANIAALAARNRRLVLVPGAGHGNPLTADVWRELDAWREGDPMNTYEAVVTAGASGFASPPISTP